MLCRLVLQGKLVAEGELEHAVLGVGLIRELGKSKVVATIYDEAVELVGYSDRYAEVNALDAWEVGRYVHAKNVVLTRGEALSFYYFNTFTVLPLA